MDLDGLTSDSEERIRRGAEAAGLLAGGVFLAAVVAISAKYAAEARDAKTKDEAWEAVIRARALNDVMNHLRAQIMDGRAAQAAVPTTEAPVVMAAAGVELPYQERANHARHAFLANLKAKAEQVRDAEAASILADGVGALDG